MRRNKKDITKKAVRRESYRHRCTCGWCMVGRNHNTKVNAKAKQEDITHYYKEQS